ncbi:hypothetical protein [Pedobacter sp.]
MNTADDFGKQYIPKQRLGEYLDVKEERTFATEAEAVDFFFIARKRLLDVNHWAELAGTALSTFKLTNGFGNIVERDAEVGDYLRIDIPGPGTTLGKGYDWVKIEEIAEESEAGMDMISLRARPASNPLSGTNNETAHFLTEQATSTFQIKRIGKHIYAEEHGRNEQANTYTTRTLDNLRNMFVGWAAMMGFSYPQWKALVKGLIETK